MNDEVKNQVVEKQNKRKEDKAKRKHIRHSEAEKQKAVQLVKDDASYSAAARQMGLHTPMVRKWCEDASVRSGCARLISKE